MIILLSALVLWGVPQNPKITVQMGTVKPVLAGPIQADQIPDSPVKDIVPVSHGLRVERSSAKVLVSPKDLVELAPPVSHEDWWQFIYMVEGTEEDRSSNIRPVFLFRPSPDGPSMTLLQVYGVDVHGNQSLVQSVWVRTKKEPLSSFAGKVKDFDVAVSNPELESVCWYCDGKLCAYSRATSGTATTSSLNFPSGKQTLQLVASDNGGSVFEQDVPVVLEPAIRFKVDGHDVSDTEHLRVSPQSHTLALSAVASTAPSPVKSLELILAGSPIASSTDPEVSGTVELKGRAPGPLHVLARAAYANGLVTEEEFTARVASNAFFGAGSGTSGTVRRGH